MNDFTRFRVENAYERLEAALGWKQYDNYKLRGGERPDLAAVSPQRVAVKLAAVNSLQLSYSYCKEFCDERKS